MFITQDNYTLDNLSHADWVIETKEQNIRYELYLWWEKHWKGQLDITFSMQSIIRPYTELTGSLGDLKAKCTFVKVNDVVVCLLQPVGRYADHSKMESFVKKATGIYGNFMRVSDVVNAGKIPYHILHPQDGQIARKGWPCEMENLNQEQRRLFSKVEFILLADGDFLAERVLNTWRNIPEKPAITFVAEHVINYRKDFEVKQDLRARPLECYAYISLIKIHGICTALVSNSGIYSDHEKLGSSVGKWCPNVKRMIGCENLSEIFRDHLSPLMQPAANQLLKQLDMPELQSAAVPHLPPVQGSKASLFPSPAPMELDCDFRGTLPSSRGISGDSTMKPITSPEVLQNSDDDEDNPFLCRIGREEMTDPVVTPRGHSYERSKIEEWVAKHGTSPMTREKITLGDLKPNIDLKAAIEYNNRKKKEK